MIDNHINVSGTNGSGTSVHVYETPDYAHSLRGAYIAHGSYCQERNDDLRVDVVDLHLPGLDIRVRVDDDVRAPLQALYDAIKVVRERARQSRSLDWDSEEEVDDPDPWDTRRRAFDDLCAVVLGIAGKHLTVAHFQAIAQCSFDDGVRHGAKTRADQIRNLLEMP